MLNFNKKKYVSFDNLSKFSGMIQKALSDKLKNVETNLDEKIDSRFKSLTAKEQADSEVVEAREGKISLVENLKTYTKKKEHLELYEEVKGMYSEINNTRKAIDANSQHINILDEEAKTNKPIIQKVNDFVDSFRCEFELEPNGYIKFPTAFGGLIIRWGTVGVPARSSVIVDFEFPFNQIFVATSTANGGDLASDVGTLVMCENHRIHLANAQTIQRDISYIAIGK